MSCVCAGWWSSYTNDLVGTTFRIEEKLTEGLEHLCLMRLEKVSVLFNSEKLLMLSMSAVSQF